MPLAISHGTRDEARSYPLGRRGSRGSPGPDCEGDKNGSQPRRRIAVAVSVLHQELSPYLGMELIIRAFLSVEGVEREKSSVAETQGTAQAATIVRVQAPIWGNANS